MEIDELVAPVRRVICCLAKCSRVIPQGFIMCLRCGCQFMYSISADEICNWVWV